MAPRKKPPATEPEPPAESDLDLVIVVRTKTEEGVSWNVGELRGAIDPDMVPAGLRLAAKDVEERLGIAGR